MYNLRARVRAALVGSVRPQLGIGAQSLPPAAASQVTPSQALELIDVEDINTVPESEVPSVSENILNQTVEATQPPTLDCLPKRSFVSVRDTPPNLGTSADLSANHAADFAAILGPSVDATPTRNPTADIAPIDQHMLRAEAHSPTLTLKLVH